MRKRLNLVQQITSILLLFTLTATACGRNREPAAAPASVHQAAPLDLPAMPDSFAGEVYLYVVGPLSGEDAAKGLAVAAGARLAVDEINRQGGLLDHQVILETINDRGDPNLASEAAQTILQQQQNGANIIGVLLSEYSDPALAALPIYLADDGSADGGIDALLLSPVANTLQPTTVDDPRFLRLTALPAEQVTEVATAMQVQGLTDVAMVYGIDEQGEHLGELFTRASESQGLALRGSHAIDPFAISYQPEVTQIQAANPAGLFYAGEEIAAAQLLTELFGFEFQGTVFGLEDAFSLNLIDELGCRANGMFLASPLPAPAAVFSLEQQQHYAQLNGQSPAAHSVAGYAAFEVLAQAYGANDSFDTEQAAAYLRSESVTTHLGELTFDANGNVTEATIHFLQVDGDTFRPAFTRTVGAPVAQAETDQTQGRPLLNKEFTQEPLVFAGLNWESATLNNTVARLLVEGAFGIPTQSDPGSSVPLFQKMRTGDVDIYMEAWLPNAQELYEKALADGQIVDLGQNFDNARQGWYVPRYLVEGAGAPAPDLRTVADLANYHTLFAAPQQPALGRLLDGSPGWFSTKINCMKLKTYRLDDKYQQVILGSSATLFGELRRAYENREPVLVYLFEPTWPIAAFDLVQLEEPDYSEECWQAGKGCAFPPSEVKILANHQLPEKAPEVVALLEQFAMSTPEISELLYTKQQTADLTTEALALQWLQENEATWSAWVPAAALSDVNAALTLFEEELESAQ